MNLSVLQTPCEMRFDLLCFTERGVGFKKVRKIRTWKRNQTPGFDSACSECRPTLWPLTGHLALGPLDNVYLGFDFYVAKRVRRKRTWRRVEPVAYSLLFLQFHKLKSLLRTPDWPWPLLGFLESHQQWPLPLLCVSKKSAAIITTFEMSIKLANAHQTGGLLPFSKSLRSG